MRPCARVTRKAVLIIPLSVGMGTSVPEVSAQATSVPKALPVSDSAAAQDKPDKPDVQERMQPDQPLPKSWLSPVADERPYAFLRADVLEYRPKGNEGDFRWDVNGWYGGDYNRLWVKSEGERNTAFRLNIDRRAKRKIDLGELSLNDDFPILNQEPLFGASPKVGISQECFWDIESELKETSRTLAVST